MTLKITNYGDRDPSVALTGDPGIQSDGLDFYDVVAQQFATVVKLFFASEESLQACWTRHFPALPFDRTDKWNLILQRELGYMWAEYGPVVKSSMTSADRTIILDCLAGYLDFNLFSQVMLNLQSWALLRYRVGNAEEDTKALEAKYAGKKPSPFEPKAKMFKVAADESQAEFNRDLSTLKSLKIIAGINPGVSFRVTPVGSTPALTDSCNLSMLGVGGDQYLQVPTGYNAFYFTWENAPQVIREYDDLPEDGVSTYAVNGIGYSFRSKSGGDILNSALASRMLAVWLYMALDSTARVVLPRMNSVLLLTDADPETIRGILRTFLDSQRVEKNGSSSPEPYWPIALHEGSRIPKLTLD